MKSSEIKKKSEKELAKALKENRESLKDFRFGLSGSKTRNVKVGNALKREIAQILTELNTRTS
jgi:ribosomal protein L29